MTASDASPHPAIDEKQMEHWQDVVELLARFMETPAALIMHLHDDMLTVHAASRGENNPYEVGETEHCRDSSLYCEHVLRHNRLLFVPNALTDPHWHDNPDVKRGMINYLGLPLHWPNGDLFGTLCVLDSHPRQYDERQRQLMRLFCVMLESSLALLEKNIELENQRQLLQHLADTDELTGIYNRRAFIAESNRELLRAQRSRAPISLLMMDLDDFKHVNDRHGHDVGDRMLRLFSDCVKASKRGYDVFGRLGGEEFALLLPDTRRSEAEELAERIRDKTAAIFHHTGGQTVRLTVSIGVWQLTGNETTILESLHDADKLLYSAKHGGKNRVQSA